MTACSLIEVKFRAVAQIHKLPHFQGPQWGALFKYLYKVLDPAVNCTSAPLVIGIQAIETGIMHYNQGDGITLGLVVPEKAVRAVATMLDCFNTSATEKGHFQPNTTIRLEAVRCRISGAPWRPLLSPTLHAEDLEEEIQRLCNLSQFSIETLSPLRIYRPEGTKENKGTSTLGHKHTFCDAAYFLTEKYKDPLNPLLNQVGCNHVSSEGLVIDGGGLTWLDGAYGRLRNKDSKDQTVIGGVVGVLKIQGRPTRQQAERLVWGQYVGVGKNEAFGLGYYHLPELDVVRKVIPLRRSTSLLDRGVYPEALKSSLLRLKETPGPKERTLKDLESAGLPWLNHISSQGYWWGSPEEVPPFFSSTNTTRLCHLLRGLYPVDPMITQLTLWLSAYGDQAKDDVQ